MQFQTTTHGKVIIAGEHAVVRGVPAIVMPLFDKRLSLTYVNDDYSDELVVTCESSDHLLLKKLFLLVFEKALTLINRSATTISGHFHLKNNIAMGAGLGFSAALCVAIARWLHWQKWLAEVEIFEFSKHLEDLFHGKSSGLDIAGVIAKTVVLYQKGQQPVELATLWQPRLLLSATAQRSVTSDCIAAVAELWLHKPLRARQIDKMMEQSVMEVREALAMRETLGLPLLKQAISRAQCCFVEWNLVPYCVTKHMEMLQKEGALASKLTGAGQGGHVLSLWRNLPDPNHLGDVVRLE